MAFFRKKFPDARRATLQTRRGDGLARLYLEPRENAGILVRRIILQLDACNTRPRTRLHVNNNIHLVRLGVGDRFGRCLRPVQTLLAKRFAQTLQRLVHNLFSVSLPQANLHGGRRRGFAGRRLQSFEAHHIDKQVFPRHEV